MRYYQKLERLGNLSRAMVNKNDHEKCFHFTYAFYGNKLLKIGMNKSKTHTFNLKLPYLNKQDQSDISDQVGIHSEVDCIMKLGKIDCSRITFFNIRIDKNDNYAISRPCNGCLYLLNQVGFRNVFFTTNNQTIEKLKI